jgi:hypothetical protein
MQKYLFFLLATLLGNTFLFAQTPTTTAPKAAVQPALPATLVSARYALQTPALDLADRFGTNSSIGLGVYYKTQSNWLVGIDGDFLFGNKIAEDSLMGNLATKDGYLINQDGSYADVRFYERGYAGMLKVGKIIPLSHKNANSGLLLMLGGGALQHKIRIENKEGQSPQLQGEYIKGYDRLTNGPALSGMVGYLFLDNNKLINFFGGIEAIYGFTRNRRSYNFDTQRSETQLRHDLLLGIRVGWMLPIYGGSKKQERFYTN